MSTTNESQLVWTIDGETAAALIHELDGKRWVHQIYYGEGSIQYVQERGAKLYKHRNQPMAEAIYQDCFRKCSELGLVLNISRDEVVGLTGNAADGWGVAQ